MSQHDDFDRSLARWFEAEARPAATTDVLDRALRATSRRRPRPGLYAALGSHWIGDGAGTSTRAATLGRTGGRTSLALLMLVLILALAAVAVLVGARLLQSAPEIVRLGHLAYVTEDGLYVADWDGRNPRRIVSRSQLPGPEGCREFWGRPTWSPDGRHLAFRPVWNDQCEGFIVITDTEGSSVTTIPGSGWSIGWSPDSSRIVTWVRLWETIGVYGIDGERQAILPAPRDLMSSGDHDPSWTPDGQAALVPDAVVVPLDGTPPHVDPTLGQFTRRLRVSPDGTMIADPRGSEIVIAATDGSSQRVLGSLAPSGIGSVEWSATGDRIAFQVGDSGAGIVDVATGATTILGLPTGKDNVGVLRFSPEGDRILVSAFQAADRGWSLWSVPADGSGARELVGGTLGGDWQWLPPGSTSPSPSPRPTPTPAPSVDLGIFAPMAGHIVYGDEKGIWGVDPAAPKGSGRRVQLTSQAGTPIGWSSDGTRLLIDRQGLVVLHANGSETQLTTEWLTDSLFVRGVATISPDGSRVVFTTIDGAGDTGFLFSVDADGGSAEKLLELDGVEGVSFSPDGTRIAYVSGHGDGGHRVSVMDADGTNAREILANDVTLGAGHDHGIAWSPAGDLIALGIEGIIYTFAPDGSGFTVALRVGLRLDPYWSPDGSQLETTGPWHPAPR